MIRQPSSASRQILLCAALTAATWTAAYAAEDTPAASPAATPEAAAPSTSSPNAADAKQPAAPALPAPNPAAEKALAQRFQSMYAAFEGKAAVPDSKNFTEDFNKEVNTEQIKQVLQQVHQSVGACRIAGQVRSPVSYAGNYLLQCDKAFVPMEIAVEDKAPYRIHSMRIRPGYWKK